MAVLKVSRTMITDVLVVGGGGAGVYAAVEAIRAGVKVIIASKGKVGNSGNTIMIGGSYAMDGHSAKHVYGFEGGDDTLTKDFLLEQIIKQSFFLSEQDVAEQYVEDSPACVYEMHQWTERAGQKQIFMAPGGWLLTGRGMGRGLLQALKENPGAEIVEDVMIVDLLQKENKVTGAIGVDIYTGEIICFSAKAVILATGGYQPFSVKNTNSDMTGDGMAMAYRAGAALADLEFHLPCPTALEPENIKGSLMPFIYETVANTGLLSTDKDGKPVAIPQEMREVAEGSELEKLVTTYYWSEAIGEGRGLPGDGMYYDFSSMTDEQLNQTFNRYMGFLALLYPKGYYHGDSIEQYRDRIFKNGKKIKVGSIFEYTMGGVVITKDMESSVEGLYAAGEVGSGVFGACRIADATTEMLVQGWKAGRVASEYVKNVALTEQDQDEIVAILEKMAAPLGKATGKTGAQFIKKIEEAADLGFGICRCEANMVKAIAILENLEAELPEISVPCASLHYNFDWIRALQARNLLTCTLAGLKAANMRKESRGFHMRHDHREVNNDQWAVRILVTDQDGQMTFRTRKAKVTKYEIPKGQDESIPTYIKVHDLNFKNADFAK
jgi:succinate dehydrogenase/fumarate reductase flavoprotein subunit